MDALLTVDLGLRTGLALYGRDGRLVWYRSQHFGGLDRPRRGVHGLFEGTPGVSRLVVEGGGPIAEVWRRAADRRAIPVRRVAAEVWRSCFFDPREHSDRERSKRSADALARRVIGWSGAPRPTSLRHDAAEAVLIGLWGVLDAGWLERLLPELS